MKRTTLILAAISALALPASTQAQDWLRGGGLAGSEAGAQQRQTTDGWRINEPGDHAFVYDEARAGALGVSCWDGAYQIAFGVPNGFDLTTQIAQNERNTPLARLLANITVMQVTPRDGAGGSLGAIRLRRWTDSGSSGWNAELTSAQLSALRSASRIEVQTDRWAGVFTGSGSSRAIGGIECLG